LYGLLNLALQCYGKWKKIIYEEPLITKGLVAAAIIYVISNIFTKGYKKPWKYRRWIMSAFIGFISTLTLYSLLPDTLRFSRAIFLFSPLVFLAYILFTRYLLNKLHSEGFPFSRDKRTRFGILGDTIEFDRVKELISQTKSIDSDFIHFDINEDKRYEKIDEIISVYNLDELIFCAANLSSSDIIKLMSVSSSKKVEFKIAPPESLYIIGSNSVERKGDLFILDVNSITKSENKRKKRLFDTVSSILLLILSPLIGWFSNSIASFVKNLFSVIFRDKSLVGYSKSLENNTELPKIKQGILEVCEPETNLEVKLKLNVLYARDYKLRNDFSILLKNWRFIGEKLL